MESVSKSKQVCRLCLTFISANNFEPIDDFTRNVIDVLQLKLNIDSSNNVICTVCSANLFATFNFKQMCLCTDNSIMLYVDEAKDVQPDLKQIYIKENEKKESIIELNGQDVCRLCMQLVQDFVEIQEPEVNKIKKIVPELNLQVTIDPVICKMCSESLIIYHRFLENCSEVAEKNIFPIKSEDDKPEDFLFVDVKATIKTICESEVTNCQSEIQFSSFRIESESQKNLRKEFIIKSEFVEIKSEETSQERIKSSFNSHEILGNSEQNWDFQHTGQMKSKGMVQHNQKGRLKLKDSSVSLTYKSESKNLVKIHDSSETPRYKCNKCIYETKCKSYLKKHMIVHKNLTEVHMYKCDKCSFESKYKHNFKKHELIHNTPSEAQVYKCDKCEFETVRKCNFVHHQIRHNHSSEMQIYKCDKCDFETKFKHSLKCHQINHVDLSQVQMYKCDKCKYMTVEKCNLIRHQVTHTRNSESQIFGCELCDFTSKHRESLRRHQLRHKDASQVEMYICDKCEYKTVNKSNLVRHQLTHDDSTEGQIYKCDRCSYETRHKSYLRNHMIVHRNLAEVRMYKCDKCGFNTKYKHNFKTHELIHRENTEVQI